MSSDDLPPKEAPLAEKLKAAMERSPYTNARKLGVALGMADGSLVGKWLGRGKTSVRRITSEEHLRRLPELLSTPPDYFRDERTADDRLDELEARAVTTADLAVLVEVVGLLARGNRREALRVLSEAEAQ